MAQQRLPCQQRIMRHQLLQLSAIKFAVKREFTHKLQNVKFKHMRVKSPLISKLRNSSVSLDIHINSMVHNKDINVQLRHEIK